MDIKKILRPHGNRPAKVYFIGIKGTGTSALAELMRNSGVEVSGSDRAEVFYTDAVLKELDIPYYGSFEASHIRDDFDLVVYSAAYDPETNPELAEAQRRSLPVLKYTDALGAYSAGFDSAGIAGVHGKTTTTAIAGVLLRSLGLPAKILAGGAVAGFNGHSTLSLGDTYFIAETCEYRRHFLAFHPRRIVLTAVESDHQDFFPTYESIRDAFVEYGRRLPSGGELIYCADDSGASETAAILKAENRGIRFIPYGFSAEGEYRIVSYKVENERALFEIAGFPGELKMRVPGRHEALNAAAALALTSLLVKKEFGGWNEKSRGDAQKALEDFSGPKRRSEITGEAGGILFMDDYGHHPTAIKKTLEGLRAFYPRRRLVVSFMPHTYTRTAALLDEFASSFRDAGLLALHKIYASARESYSGGVTGETLFERVKNLDPSAGFRAAERVFYFEEPMDSFDFLKKNLKPGDLFITVGAGNNWPLGLELYNYFRTVDTEGGRK
ncbi:MAG: UDP-N-acetylmuramate--L-alanine ligase [Treponema sp.]|jgi:UDP-N-acetylmuramate--alanine ligase|nr:UDP-N-acetylmuramate--L-alanine ligase [Treponema sp.]